MLDVLDFHTAGHNFVTVTLLILERKHDCGIGDTIIILMIIGIGVGVTLHCKK